MDAPSKIYGLIIEEDDGTILGVVDVPEKDFVLKNEEIVEILGAEGFPEYFKITGFDTFTTMIEAASNSEQGEEYIRDLIKDQSEGHIQMVYPCYTVNVLRLIPQKEDASPDTEEDGGLVAQ